MKNTLCNIAENFNMPQAFRGAISHNIELSLYTSFQIGGRTPLFLQPSSSNDVILILNHLRQQQIPFFILGGGSNLVVSDEGIPVPVVSTRSLTSIDLIHEGNSVLLRCGSGALIEDICAFCIANAIEGLENFAGLPGTAGGAVYMNARCYDKSISDVLFGVQYLDVQNNGYNEVLYHFNEKDWSYKKSPFQQNKSVLTQIYFHVQRGEKNRVAEQCARFIHDREEKGHFKYPSAGSVFKNNHSFGKPSGKIIDEAGLRGLKRGGAQIAPWHGNFIINTGNARASDVKELVCIAQSAVLEKFGFKLELEIIFTQDLF